MKKKRLKVLSLFDGCSMAMVAIKKAGFSVDKYYASEIDKYAMTVSKNNFPEIIQLGDIEKWQDWQIETPDLIIGGSPCQGFSIAGKQLNFNDPRSKLFFTFLEILKHYKPKYFLLENVKMKKEFQEVINKAIGVLPVEINSSLLSAQNRKRLYWSNIEINQPKDRKVYLKDIIEAGAVDRVKSYCIDANYYKGGNLKQYFEKHRRQLVFNKLAVVAYSRGKDRDGQRILAPCGKNGTLKAPSKNSGAEQNPVTEDFKNYRKLTPIESERLQTLPDNYTEGVSNTQRYKMIGNGFTVDVISHILKGLKENKKD